MSYGKYGFKAIGRGGAPNDITGRAYQDPMFALGELLGRAYSNNYAQRGTDKAIATGTQALEDAYGGGSGQGAQAMMDAYNATQPQAQMFAPQNPQLMGENPQLPMPKGTELGREEMINNPALLDALTKNVQDAQSMQNTTMATPASMYAGRLGALQNISPQKFDPYKAQEILNGIAQQRGLVGDERTRFFETMAPVVGKYQKQYANDLNVQKLGSFKAAMDSGDYNAAREIGMGLMQENPQMAAAMMGSVPNPVALHTMNYNTQRLAQAQQLAAQQAEANKQKAYKAEQKEADLAIDKEMASIIKSMETYEKLWKDESGNWKAPEYEDKYKKLAAVLESRIQTKHGMVNSGGKQEEFDGWNDYGKIGVWANNQLDKGVKPEDVYSKIMANTDMGNKIVSDLKTGRDPKAGLKAAPASPGLLDRLVKAVSDATSIDTVSAANRKKTIHDLERGETTIRDIAGIARQ